MNAPRLHSLTPVDTMFRVMDAADALRQQGKGESADDGVLLSRIRDVYQQQGTPMEETVLWKAFHQVHGRYPTVVSVAPQCAGACNVCGTELVNGHNVCGVCAPPFDPPSTRSDGQFNREPDRLKVDRKMVWIFSIMFSLAILAGVLGWKTGEHMDLKQQRQMDEGRQAGGALNRVAEDALKQIAEQSLALNIQHLKQEPQALEVQTLNGRLESERMRGRVHKVEPK